MPEILKINFVLNSNNCINVKGNDVIRCEIRKSGFEFFNSLNKGKKHNKKIIKYENLLLKKP